MQKYFKIYSDLLENEIIIVLDKDIYPNVLDNYTDIPIYTPNEIKILKNKDKNIIQNVYDIKNIFDTGTNKSSKVLS